MHTTIPLEQRQVTKREIIQQIAQGIAAKHARVHSVIPMHRTTVYRLLKRVQSEGEQALTDGWHGHPAKLHGEVLAFVVERCQTTACISSPAVQRALQERFALRVKRQSTPPGPGKPGTNPQASTRENKLNSVSAEPGYSEGAGGLLHLAAVTETGLLTQLEKALPPAPISARSQLANRSAVVHQRLLLILLFLGAVGLHRRWDLRGYTAAVLALLDLPQASPGISLHKFVETVLMPKYNRGERREPNPAYQRIRNAIDRPSGGETVKRLVDCASSVAHCRARPSRSRLPQAPLPEICRRPAAWLPGIVRWENADHAYPNEMIGLRVPKEVIEQKCACYMRGGKPAQRAEMLGESDYGILIKYQAEYRGGVQYYLLAHNENKRSSLSINRPNFI